MAGDRVKRFAMSDRLSFGRPIARNGLIPLRIDGLIYANSMVMLDSARRRFPRLHVGGSALGIPATLVANVAHGLGQGLGQR